MNNNNTLITNGVATPPFEWVTGQVTFPAEMKGALFLEVDSLANNDDMHERIKQWQIACKVATIELLIDGKQTVNNRTKFEDVHIHVSRWVGQAAMEWVAPFFHPSPWLTPRTTVTETG